VPIYAEGLLFSSHVALAAVVHVLLVLCTKRLFLTGDMDFPALQARPRISRRATVQPGARLAALCRGKLRCAARYAFACIGGSFCAGGSRDAALVGTDGRSRRRLRADRNNLRHLAAVNPIRTPGRPKESR
jgi:hypothetical protein